MTAITSAPRKHRSLLGLAVAILNARAQARGHRYSQVADALKSHFLTFCTCALIDVGAFHWSQIAGYMITGLSLVVIDSKIQEG